MVYERIKALCKRREITIRKLERDLGFARGHVFKWKTSSPSFENVVLVANYFGVSTDYFIGNLQ